MTTNLVINIFNSSAVITVEVPNCNHRQLKLNLKGC